MSKQQQEAAKKAESYRAIEAKILTHIATIEASSPTPADKRYISQQRKLAEQNRSRAMQQQAIADGNN